MAFRGLESREVSVRRGLVRALRDGLAALADEDKAPQMQAYMKSAMPYRGVQTPLRRKMQKKVFAQYRLVDFATWRDTVLQLWRHASFREERYCAIDLAGENDEMQTRRALPLYRELIVTGAWWDLVDPVATHRLRRLLQKYPGSITRTMLEWSRCRDLWKRRSSILCQVGRKQETDLELLFACIEPNLDRSEFFLRKAIGWALRDYAWFDPATVQEYVATQGDRLSGLSRREALKNIGARSAPSSELLET